MPLGANVPPEWERCMKDLKTKQPELDGESRARICWASIEKTHKKENGKWIMKKKVKELQDELDIKIPPSVYVKPEKEEVITAIKSVPTIPDPDKLIEQMDERVRLIKGFKGLTSGVYNGFDFTEDVLRDGADTWNKNPHKPGVPFPVKMEHGKNIMKRVGHLLNTYFEDGWIKHDILLTSKDAVEKFDEGHLTDGSERVTLGTDVANSTRSKVPVVYVKGRGIDFVDNPACKRCGINPEKEALFNEIDELLEAKGMAEENRTGNESGEQDASFEDKVKGVLQKFGLFKEEETEEEEDELEETEEEEELEEEEEELCGGSSGGSKKKKPPAKEEETEEMEEHTEEQTVSLEEHSALEERVAQLENDNKKLRKDAELEAHGKILKEVTELHDTLGDEYNEEELSKKSDEVLEERLSQLKVRASERHEGDVPYVNSQLAEERKNKTKDRKKELQEELENKGHKR